MSIFNNNSLTNIDGLSNLVRVRDDLVMSNNIALTNINGLASLETVGNFNGEGRFSLENNPLLTSLDGLENYLAANDGTYIRHNELLSDFCALKISFFGIGLVIEGNAYNPEWFDDILYGNCSL